MRTVFLSGLVGLVLVTVSGCITQEPAFIPLTKETSQRINSSNGVIVATQKEITADIEKSQVATAMGGGLIPALIDVAIEKSRASSAEELIKPIRDALIEFEMGKEMQQALGTRLETNPWLHLKRTETVYENKPDHVAGLLAASSEDALLLITPSYTLGSDFQSLKVEAEVKVLPRAFQLRPTGEAKDDKGKVTPLYKTTVSHLMPLVVGGSDKESAAQEWAKDGGVIIKEAMKRGVASIADKIVEALAHPDGSLTGP